LLDSCKRNSPDRTMGKMGPPNSRFDGGWLPWLCGLWRSRFRGWLGWDGFARAYTRDL